VLISEGVPGEEVEGYLPWFQEESDTSSTEFVAIFNTNKSHRKVFTKCSCWYVPFSVKKVDTAFIISSSVQK
jgi:hypothetical protein